MDTTVTDDPTRRRLIDAKEVGKVLGCSWRTVYRLADRGAIPTGVKLGALRRWDALALDEFIAGGCRRPKPAGRP
jgi:excisionase family DNA binding protein